MCDCGMHDWGTRMINLLIRNRENSKKNREKERQIRRLERKLVDSKNEK